MFAGIDFSKLINSKKFYALIGAIVVACIIPVIWSSPYIVDVLTLIVIFTIFASSWNLLAYSGQGSLGHAAFLGIGGFVSGLIAIAFGIPPIISVFIGGMFSAVIGLLIGLACVRLKAWFLGMVTFGFAVIVESLFKQFDVITHTVDGFSPPALIAGRLPFYFLAFTFAVTSIAAIYFIMKSKWGLAFKAIHENEQEARMTGINTAKYKLLAFVISTFFAGLAGSLYAYSLNYVNTSFFSAENSFLPLIICVIGGLGTIEGPIIGAIVYQFINNFLSSPSVNSILQASIGPLFPNVSNVGSPLRFIILGIFLILVVIFAPKGLSSIFKKLYSRFSGYLKGVKLK
jgi:branched-chain amino acid transport system permease protein